VRTTATIQIICLLIGLVLASAAGATPAPTISYVVPPNGLPGTEITIIGSGFGFARGRGQVWLGTANGVIESWSDTQVVARIAPGSTSGKVQVLQNGALSNAFQFIVNTPHIRTISSASGRPGDSIVFTGSGFGSYQGDGVVWLGSTAGAVLSWSDTQVIAAVASTAVTGIARIEQNGVWSNFAAFFVPGGRAILYPDLLNLMVGEGHRIQALTLDKRAVPIKGLTWESTDPSVVSLSADDPPLLTAVRPGHATIVAGGASTDVTVSAGPLPLGTVRWSDPFDAPRNGPVRLDK
jgi:IPT/TIG domain